jgi:hypothetical protein
MSVTSAPGIANPQDPHLCDSSVEKVVAPVHSDIPGRIRTQQHTQHTQQQQQQHTQQHTQHTQSRAAQAEQDKARHA